MSSSALWLYEFKFQMVSGYSTLVQFQSGTRRKNSWFTLQSLITALPSPKQKRILLYTYFIVIYTLHVFILYFTRIFPEILKSTFSALKIYNYLYLIINNNFV